MAVIDFESISKFESFITNDDSILALPVISKGENWVRVNDLVILPIENRFRVSKLGKPLVYFSKRSWAVAWAVAYVTSNSERCLMLQSSEKILSKYLEDINMYNARIDSSREKNDILKENIMLDRLSRTQREYDYLTHEIDSIIKTQLDV